MKLAIHLKAKNDMNGNPRRVFVVIDTDPRLGCGESEIIDVIDEGYAGDGELRRNHGLRAELEFETTPAERRALLSRYGKDAR
jgi:hypothetical protein